MMITKTHDTGRVAMTGTACAAALDGRFALFGARSVSPVYAPTTGAVRPKATNADVLIVTRLVDGNKGDVRVRSLGPPI
ncbi:hypothetical protein [Phytoactinopolyspora mesophila]|uniref:Uncharacterized protein n=1 Tax=Phytoactinopolyspora mesophila TaxID=2650750 RepID=A0A7K3MCI6_9ACTN|nr:hypothetical protein [Phytoactinopolyspora mesophila]NDL61039.1 hypothetical protein [Phytoactinopolyspora mesophila]